MKLFIFLKAAIGALALDIAKQKKNEHDIKLGTDVKPL